MKLGVISLGCDKATVDSERLVGELVGHGARVVADLEGADVVLVNTCGFIDAAKRESVEAILEAQGAREINLVAQDLGHYGRDLGRDGPKLPDLLQALLRETSVPWYRLLYVYSAGLTPRLLDLMAAEPRIVPYIDLPIQHASDAQLERMGRPERRATIRDKVRLLRETLPDVAIRTTAIVGFPGETEDDFTTLRDFAEEIAFERLGVFTYSEQEGTRAAQYPDDVPDDVKRARQEELLEVARVASGDRLSRFVGRTTDDDVDGVTYLQCGGWACPGELVRATILENDDYDFRAAARP